MAKTTSMNSARKIYIDYIRIFAIFLVLFTHTGVLGSKLYTVRASSTKTILYVLFDCFRTINNPLLFMISGVLLLGKDEPVSLIWKKRISRFVLILFVFSFLYALKQHIISNDVEALDVWGTFRSIMKNPIKTSYWFLYSYVAFLMILPFLRVLAQNMKFNESLYLLLIGILVSDVFKLTALILNIDSIYISIYFNQMIILYPLLGYSIERNWDSITTKLQRRGFVIMGAIACLSWVLSAWMTCRQFHETQTWSENWIVLFDSILAFFVFITFKRLDRILKPSALITAVSGSVFGIYLLEDTFKSWTMPVFNLFDSFLPTIVACLIWLMTTMVIGTAVVWLIKLIPGVNRFL